MRKMRKMVMIPLVVLMFAMVMCFVGTVLASDSNTYSVVKTSPSTVMPGDPVLMTATTSNAAVDVVEWAWYAPGSYPAGPATYTSTDATPSDGFTSSEVLSTAGYWTIVATFKNSAGTPIYVDTPTGTLTYSVLVVVTVNVVPELPLIGTAGAAVAMVGGLVFIKKRKFSVA